MMKRLSRMLFGLGCVSCLILGISCRPSPSAAIAGQTPTTQPTLMAVATTLPSYATPSQLEIAAVQSAMAGNFKQSDEYLTRAAATSQNPEVTEMRGWVSDFEAQRETFDDARRKQFQLAVDNAHILINHKMDEYAMDEVSRAYLLADDKKQFRQEKWVDDLVTESVSSADTDEAKGLWLKAWRMYQDLSVVEPSTPLWKAKLKVAALRLRLLLNYAPDPLKKLQEAELHDREAADKLIIPATRPSVASATTQHSDLTASGNSTTEPSEALNSTTRPDDNSPDISDSAATTDWHDMTRGIQFDMLYVALALADQEYYRDVTFQTLLSGGLNGLQTLVTTDGLEATFPGLKDQAGKKQFLDAIDDWKAKAAAASNDDAQVVVARALRDLRELNQRTIKLPEEVFVSEFADGAFSKLDYFTNVIWPYDMEELEKTTEGEFGGVGIQIQLDDTQQNIVVVQPLPDTPAWRAGIRPGDIIAKINGKSAKGLSTDSAVKIITGVPGTSVVLTMRSTNGAMKDYNLKREMIKVASIKGATPRNDGQWNYMLDPDNGIGYIRLTSFSKTTAEDLGQAIDELKAQHAKALILDLRYNPGGLLDTAKKVVNKFIDHGVIVSTHADRNTTSNPPSEMDADPKDIQTAMPLIVLVNQYSASASEIVSGALKDWHRALIVGQRTFGKGSVQMLFPLGTKQACLKLTTSHYYLPSGRCIHREENSSTWGVDPDVTIEMTPSQMYDENLQRTRLDVPDDIALSTGLTPTTRPTMTDVLKADPQLSAALLILRLQLTSADLATPQAAMR
jgi:carboxyl-terminal processing protease